VLFLSLSRSDVVIKRKYIHIEVYTSGYKSCVFTLSSLSKFHNSLLRESFKKWITCTTSRCLCLMGRSFPYTFHSLIGTEALTKEMRFGVLKKKKEEVIHEIKSSLCIFQKLLMHFPKVAYAFLTDVSGI